VSGNDLGLPSKRLTYLGPSCTASRRPEGRHFDFLVLWLDLAATLTPYFESHAVGTIWIVACIATAIAEATGMFRYRAGANKRDGGSGLVLRLIMIPAIASVILSPQVAPGAAIHPPLTSFIIGTFIFTAGEALRIWSRVTLGRTPEYC
jgi:hypothetical protein